MSKKVHRSHKHSENGEESKHGADRATETVTFSRTRQSEDAQGEIPKKHSASLKEVLRRKWSVNKKINNYKNLNW